MSLLVEQPLPSDAGRVGSLRVERARRGDTALAETLVEIDLQSYLEATFSRFAFQALLHAGETFLLKADDEIVGGCVCTRSWEPVDDVTILTIGIVPGWRGRGVGQRFLGWVLDALAEDGARTVSLTVGSENQRALRIYRELGFQTLRESEPEPITGERQLLLRARIGAF